MIGGARKEQGVWSLDEAVTLIRSWVSRKRVPRGPTAYVAGQKSERGAGSIIRKAHQKEFTK